MRRGLLIVGGRRPCKAAKLQSGVVSMPHGFGQNRPGVQLRVATTLGGASFNDLADDDVYDLPSGSSVLTGIPVSVEAAPHIAVDHPEVP